jgi:ferritin-like metal-binding protein YciE
VKESQLQEKLVDYIQDAHAMEKNVLRMLESMIATTKDVETKDRLEKHRQETERHERLLHARLEALGARRSVTADMAAIAGALLKGVADQVRVDKPGKNARDGFITEHTEIAAYQLLERLAQHAGDGETARVAREIRADEERMAAWIDERWEKFIDLTLAEAGLGAPAPGGPRAS